MFGIGAPEMVIIALIFLLIFGPSKMPEMARDIGKFVGQARGAIDEFKDELTAETEVEESKDERPARKREERSRRDHGGGRNSSRNGSGDEPEDEYGEGSSDSRRERAEYDL